MAMTLAKGTVLAGVCRHSRNARVVHVAHQVRYRNPVAKGGGGGGGGSGQSWKEWVRDPLAVKERQFQLDSERKAVAARSIARQAVDEQVSRRGAVRIRDSDMNDLEQYLEYFTKTKYVQRKSETLGISKKLLRGALAGFVDGIRNDSLPHIRLANVVLALRLNHDMEKILFPALFKYINDTFPAEASELLTDLIRLSDLRAPPDWHPEARTMKREIHLHVGPTNSGKTHSAIQRLKTVKRGIYCGPLRLLAHEIYDRFNREGMPMNLVTGEERRVSDGVQLYSSTVEMAFVFAGVRSGSSGVVDVYGEADDLASPEDFKSSNGAMEQAGAAFDVAVIDEIQMIADGQRGWAWTQAVLGLPAKELHLCGEETAVDLLKKLCEETGDVLKIYRYERLTPLEVDPRSLDGNLKLVEPKDCVVTFSRNNVFAIKREIERKTKYRCAVVYGSLPPEIRAEQAKAFNAKQSPYDILVASDAIGMGLNLNIRRIVFERLEKFDGKNTRDLSYSQIKQIGGRAGRFKTDFETGYVTTLESADVNLLQKAMAARLPALPSAGLLPTLDMIERFAKLLPEDSLSSLLDKFEQLARVDGNYFLCNLENQKRVASLLEPLTSLSLRDRFLFCQSPAPLDDGGIGERSLVRMARAVALRQQCVVDDLVQLPNEDFLPQRTEQLQDLETVHKVIVLYLWLSFRFPNNFPGSEGAASKKSLCEHLINRGLEHLEFRIAKRTKKTPSGEEPAQIIVAPRIGVPRSPKIYFKASEVDMLGQGNRKKDEPRDPKATVTVRRKHLPFPVPAMSDDFYNTPPVSAGGPEAAEDGADNESETDDTDPLDDVTTEAALSDVEKAKATLFAFNPTKVELFNRVLSQHTADLKLLDGDREAWMREVGSSTAAIKTAYEIKERRMKELEDLPEPKRTSVRSDLEKETEWQMKIQKKRRERAKKNLHKAKFRRRWLMRHINEFTEKLNTAAELEKRRLMMQAGEKVEPLVRYSRAETQSTVEYAANSANMREVGKQAGGAAKKGYQGRGKQKLAGKGNTKN